MTDSIKNKWHMVSTTFWSNLLSQVFIFVFSCDYYACDDLYQNLFNKIALICLLKTHNLFMCSLFCDLEVCLMTFKTKTSIFQ